MTKVLDKNKGGYILFAESMFDIVSRFLLPPPPLPRLAYKNRGLAGTGRTWGQSKATDNNQNQRDMIHIMPDGTTMTHEEWLAYIRGK